MYHYVSQISGFIRFNRWVLLGSNFKFYQVQRLSFVKFNLSVTANQSGGADKFGDDIKRIPLQTTPAKKILFELKVKIMLKVLTIAYSYGVLNVRFCQVVNLGLLRIYAVCNHRF